jgi:hypothetical protein
MFQFTFLKKSFDVADQGTAALWLRWVQGVIIGRQQSTWQDSIQPTVAWSVAHSTPNLERLIRRQFPLQPGLRYALLSEASLILLDKR